jgi:hypothetical protein
MMPCTHVEDAARFNDIYRRAILVDASKDSTATERPHRRVKGIRLYIETYTVRQCLGTK